MNDSLSIILTVRNAEASLAPQVHHLLDLLPDLTTQFEIVVVDDGSTDHTVDLAREMAREFPQLTLVSHSEPRGRESAVKTGLASARGRTLLVQEDRAAVSPTLLRRLWSLRHDRGVVMARTQQRPGLIDDEILERLSTWGQSLRNLAKRASTGGIQMIRRDAAQSLAGSNPNSARCTTEPIARPSLRSSSLPTTSGPHNSPAVHKNERPAAGPA